MKKSLSLLFSTLLLAATLNAATPQQNSSARAGGVLADGQPPLTREMADGVALFFEWLFEARFTPSERGELDAILVAAWRRDDRGEIKAVADIGELNAKLAAAPEEKRREVREAMRPEVVRDLRAESSDFARLLLAVYEGRGEGDTEAAQTEDAGSAPAAAAELLGSWRSSQLGMISYQNTITGASRPGRGTTMQYSFQPGGRYEYNGYLETTVYNCTTTYFNPVKGRYRLEGSRLVLTPETNRWQSRNNCAASMNKDVAGKLEAQVYTWRVRTEQGRRELCLASVGGGEVCYRKE
jgi:hypothetical protein